MSISRDLRKRVILEAHYRCEYCQTSSRLTGTPLVMDHVVPRSLGGGDERSNLAAACYRCNEYKGAKTHGQDPETGQLVTLFNPRQQIWSSAFQWGNGGTHILGRMDIGSQCASTTIEQRTISGSKSDMDSI